jgi:hypothetical protein
MHIHLPRASEDPNLSTCRRLPDLVIILNLLSLLYILVKDGEKSSHLFLNYIPHMWRKTDLNSLAASPSKS